MAIRINESKIALKSGFEKYLRVEKDGTVQGVADAVGSMEQWEPVFQVLTPFYLKMYYYFYKAVSMFRNGIKSCTVKHYAKDLAGLEPEKGEKHWPMT